jgi:hypothetical protein
MLKAQIIFQKIQNIFAARNAAPRQNRRGK